MADEIHHKSVQCLNLINFCIWAQRANLKNVNLGKTIESAYKHYTS